jgi:hypothetical protein
MATKIFNKRTLYITLVLVLSLSILVPGTGCGPAMGCQCTKEQQFVYGVFIALVMIAYENANIDKDARPVSAGPEKLKPCETPTGGRKKEIKEDEPGGVPSGLC